MRRKLLAVSLVLLTGVVLLGVALLRGYRKEDPFSPPAPDAPDAPDWTTEEADAASNQESAEEAVQRPMEESRPKPPEPPPEKPAEEPPEDPHAKCGWPAAPELPLRIIIEDLPVVPETIVDPSSPIEEE